MAAEFHRSSGQQLWAVGLPGSSGVSIEVRGIYRSTWMMRAIASSCRAGTADVLQTFV